LRENKVLIGDLQRKLKDHTEQMEMTKKQYADWNAELSRKLQDLREQKRNWVSETAALRLTEKELRVCTFLLVTSRITHNSLQAQFVAQGNLLAEAERRESRLKTSIKETEHKVARLNSYEQRIEQHTAMQKLW
jgi:chromosome segregation ATPase